MTYIRVRPHLSASYFSSYKALRWSAIQGENINGSCDRRPSFDDHALGAQAARSDAAGRAGGDRALPGIGCPGAHRLESTELALRCDHRAGAAHGHCRSIPPILRTLPSKQIGWANDTGAELGRLPGRAFPRGAGAGAVLLRGPG